MLAGHKNGIVPFVPLISYTPPIRECVCVTTKHTIVHTLRAHMGILKQWDRVGQWDRCRKINAYSRQKVDHS